MINLGRSLFSRRSKKINNWPAFLERLSNLMQEGYMFHDGLVLLLPYHSKRYNELLKQTEKFLSAGFGATDILRSLGISANYLLPVIVAEVDGRMVDALRGISERMKHSEERKKKLRNLLLYPLVLFSFLALFLLLYRSYFLPNLQALTMTGNNAATGFVSFLPLLVSRIPDVLIGGCVLIIIATSSGMLIYRRMLPNRKIRFMMSIPIVGSLFSKWKTRDFSGELGSLLQSGLSMQDALEVLVEQDADKILSEIATTIKGHVIYGESFDMAIRQTAGLRKELSHYAKHGSDTGHLAKELLLFSENLHEVIEEELGKWLALLQPALFAILAICILAAYLALLLPVYSMFETL